MGRTPLPLKIVVLPNLGDPYNKLADALSEKGHEVYKVDVSPGHDYVPPTKLQEADLVIGSNAHYFDPSWGEKELEQAMKWARKKRYPRRKGEKI